jgi:hypothetical protein
MREMEDMLCDAIGLAGSVLVEMQRRFPNGHTDADLERIRLAICEAYQAACVFRGRPLDELSARRVALPDDIPF